jgi:hypothetical protein
LLLQIIKKSEIFLVLAGIGRSFPHAHSLDPYNSRIAHLLRIGAFLGRRWNVGKRHRVGGASKRPTVPSRTLG